jgi:hypothetical protein
MGGFTDSAAARGFWRSVGAAIAALARRTGCSIEQSPLPEIREVGREWRAAGA